MSLKEICTVGGGGEGEHVLQETWPHKICAAKHDI